MTFLKRANELGEFTKSLAGIAEFRRECWPEILAVVKAAQIERWSREKTNLYETLEALDKKAEEG